MMMVMMFGFFVFFSHSRFQKPNLYCCIDMHCTINEQWYIRNYDSLDLTFTVNVTHHTDLHPFKELSRETLSLFFFYKNTTTITGANNKHKIPSDNSSFERHTPWSKERFSSSLLSLSSTWDPLCYNVCSRATTTKDNKRRSRSSGPSLQIWTR